MEELFGKPAERGVDPMECVPCGAAIQAGVLTDGMGEIVLVDVTPLTLHVETLKEPDAEKRFKEIAEAYAVLSDPKKRVEYDARGFAGVAGVSPEDLFGDIDFGDLFRGFGFDVGLGQGVSLTACLVVDAPVRHAAWISKAPLRSHWKE